MTVELRSRIAVMLLTAIVVMGTRKAHYSAIAGWLSGTSNVCVVA